MAVDSITKTLQANVPQVGRLKILVHGQEAETLAGHLDLNQTFLVNTSATPVPPRASTPTPPSSLSASLTPAFAPVKLAAPTKR
jgi:hypothetical protein